LSALPQAPVAQAVPAPPFATNHPAWLRLEDQLQWYDDNGTRCRHWYRRLKFAQLALAILIPVTGLLPAPDAAKWAAGLAGTTIALLEAVQQMNQYSLLWITYRATAERLKHEKFLFLSAAGPYRGSTEPERLTLLAERVEEHVSSEHGSWVREAQRTAGTRRAAAR